MDAALSVVIDDLLEVDVDDLADDALDAAVVGLVRESARLAAVRARVVGAWEARQLWAVDGSKSAKAALAHRAGVAASTAGAECRRARKLRHMPVTFAALATGEIGVDHADVLGAARDESRADAFARGEALLVEQAKTLSFRSFHRAVRYWRQCADDASDEDRARRTHVGRHLHTSATFAGTVEVRGALDAVGGGIVRDELRRLEQQLFHADWAEARATHGDTATADHLARTAAQRRADALAVDPVRALRVLSSSCPGYRPGLRPERPKQHRCHPQRLPVNRLRIAGASARSTNGHGPIDRVRQAPNRPRGAPAEAMERAMAWGWRRGDPAAAGRSLRGRRL